jgi:hypothetical protein
MIPLGQGQNPLSIMKSVKLGPPMNQTTYDLIRNFNNGWVKEDQPEYAEQEKIVAQHEAALGHVFVQVKIHDSDFIYYAVDVYPACRCMSVRRELLHALDRLVSQQDVTYAIYAIHLI